MTFSGPVVWQQDDVENPQFTVDTTFSMTCVGDACTIGWPAAHYGAPPAWRRGQNRISQTTPASGDLCAGTYAWGVNVNLTIARDRITGTVDRPGTELDCSATEYRIAHSASAKIDIPLTSGNPCIVERNVACSTGESEVPVAVGLAEAPATPDADESDDESTTSDSSTGKGVPIGLIVGAGAAVVAGGAATAVTVQRNRAGQSAQVKDQLTEDANRSARARADMVDNSAGASDTNLLDQPGGPESDAPTASNEAAGTQSDGGGQGERLTRGGTTPSGRGTPTSPGSTASSSGGTTGAGNTSSPWSSVSDLTSNMPGGDSATAQNIGEQVADIVDDAVSDIRGSIPPLNP